MTDHDRARRAYRIACALADVRPAARSARPWFARLAGYNPDYARQRWDDDAWPPRARALLDRMEQTPPVNWPAEWGV